MDNTNTQQNKQNLNSALSNVPSTFRPKIIDTYLSIKTAYDEGNYESAALRGGKFCEAVLRFLQNHFTQQYTPFGQKINNFTDECRKIERLPATQGDESLRVIMPKSLDYAYTIRNKRGIGHVGGDVDANQIDAATVMRVSDWVLCELMRYFHAMPLEDAQALLDAISTRQQPYIWNVAGKKRIQSTNLTKKDEVLLLLHSELQAGILVEDLQEWIGYKGRLSDFKRWVITPLHDSRLIEHDKEVDLATISPLGIKEVESRILQSL